MKISRSKARKDYGMAKMKKYWAGFYNNQVGETLEYYGDEDKVAAIYIRKKDATKHYEDVRPVEIRELKSK